MIPIAIFMMLQMNWILKYGGFYVAFSLNSKLPNRNNKLCLYSKSHSKLTKIMLPCICMFGTTKDIHPFIIIMIYINSPMFSNIT